jgi:hypothetical protein
MKYVIALLPRGARALALKRPRVRNGENMFTISSGKMNLINPIPIHLSLRYCIVLPFCVLQPRGSDTFSILELRMQAAEVAS